MFIILCEFMFCLRGGINNLQAYELGMQAPY